MRTAQQILHLATRVCKHFVARLLKKAAGRLCTLLYAFRGALDEFARLTRCDNDIEPAAMRTGTLVLSNVPCLAFLFCLALSYLRHQKGALAAFQRPQIKAQVCACSVQQEKLCPCEKAKAPRLLSKQKQKQQQTNTSARMGANRATSPSVSIAASIHSLAQEFPCSGATPAQRCHTLT